MFFSQIFWPELTEPQSIRAGGEEILELQFLFYFGEKQRASKVKLTSWAPPLY
jgi:hypothetical protein